MDRAALILLLGSPPNRRINLRGFNVDFRQTHQNIAIAGAAFGALSTPLVASEAHAAPSVLLAQCTENSACFSSTVDWSSDVTGSELDQFGLGSSVDFTAAQTSEYNIRLGVTDAVFQTATGSVDEQLGEFNGQVHSDPCHYCEVDTVGSFLIPINATSAVFSGTFGNSTVPSSGGVNLFLGGVPAVSAAPEPGTWALMFGGLAMIGGMLRIANARRRENAVAGIATA